MDIPKPPAPASRAAHGAALKQAFESAVLTAQERREAAGIQVHGAVPGLYVEFESQPGVPLKLSSLEDARKGIELVAVTHVQTDEAEPRRVEKATVFVPEGKVGHFISRFEQYSKTTEKAPREIRHEALLDPVAALRLATLRGLWTDGAEAYPKGGDVIWWEVWLRRQDGSELARLLEYAGLTGLDVAERRLQFDDRIVTLVRASSEQLAASLDVLNDLAEVRRAKETPAFFESLGPVEQAEWAQDLRRRTKSPAPDAPTICLLDTGVNRAHPLIEGALAPEDCHTCDPGWGSHDHHGHGTEMAGLALYGDLTDALASSQAVLLRHRLESVKILPSNGTNRPELYGAVTVEATARAEVQDPFRARCFAMAVAATDQRDRGQPTSWSAAIDALASGRALDSASHDLTYLDDEDSEPQRRLFILCAGNVDPDHLNTAHLDRSDTDPIHDPGQSWNAVTVGAFTDRATINDPRWDGWQPVAAPGDLSPWSTTGRTFADAWPLKPDIVFEGGNIAKNGRDEVNYPCPELSLLSTHYKPSERAFTLTWATSSATAQVARIAATIAAEYPDLWPEAVRAMIVHSADWTPQMRRHLADADGKRARARLVQRYGFGVPSLERALRSAGDALTMVVQSAIRPFDSGKLREMHLFELPWPRDVLLGLGATRARVRLTLSYFVEPNPGRRGWRKRHSYSSHGLRFDVKGPTESLEEFRKRLNQQALDEDEAKPTSGGDSSDWYLGEHARNRGSIHSDILQGSAADIAERGVIAVYPVSGWWKEQKARDRSDKGARYALVVSIETPGVDADVWTPVAHQVGLPITIET